MVFAEGEAAMDITLQVLLCILVADFLTGLFHWLEDTYLTPQMPLIGWFIAEPNIEHHREPAKLTLSGTFNRVYQSFLAAAVVGLVIWACGGWSWHIGLVLFLVAMGNEFHSWAHCDMGPVIRRIQETGLLISVFQHGRHHKRPYNRYYCTITCWVNPVLEAIHFWRALEWCVSWTGIKNKRCSAERGGY